MAIPLLLALARGEAGKTHPELQLMVEWLRAEMKNEDVENDSDEMKNDDEDIKREE